MSFILDALKKSENERQRKTPAEFATVPSSPDTIRTPRWLWVLGGLLAVNIAIVGLALLRKPHTVTSPPARSTSVAIESSPAARPATGEFAERVEQARLERPERRAPTSTPDRGQSSPDDLPGSRDDMPAAQPSRPAGNFSLLPNLTELRASGTSQLPDLHVDIHVFSDIASDRFVFINMNKYREQDRLAEGPVVREITRDGVILDDNGTAFVLLRD